MRQWYKKLRQTVPPKDPKLRKKFYEDKVIVVVCFIYRGFRSSRDSNDISLVTEGTPDLKYSDFTFFFFLSQTLFVFVKFATLL